MQRSDQPQVKKTPYAQYDSVSNSLTTNDMLALNRVLATHHFSDITLSDVVIADFSSLKRRLEAAKVKKLTIKNCTLAMPIEFENTGNKFSQLTHLSIESSEFVMRGSTYIDLRNRCLQQIHAVEQDIQSAKQNRAALEQAMSDVTERIDGIMQLLQSVIGGQLTLRGADLFAVELNEQKQRRDALEVQYQATVKSLNYLEQKATDWYLQLTKIENDFKQERYSAIKSIGNLTHLQSLTLIDLTYSVINQVNAVLETGALISDDAVIAFTCQSLQTKQPLKSLDVSNNALSATGANAISMLSTLTHLDISNNAIGNIGFRALCADESLLDSGRVAGGEIELQFEFDDFPVYNNDVLPALKVLRAANIGLTDEGMLLLSKPQLEQLDLDDNALTFISCRPLLAMPALSTISLNGNKIGDKGAILLAQGNFTSLELANNKISAKGAVVLLSDAKGHLVALSLAGNRLSGHDAIANALFYNSTLQTLDLNGTALQDQSIAHVFSKNSKTKLQVIKLRDNLLTDKVFVGMMKSAIHTIDVSGNSFIIAELQESIHTRHKALPEAKKVTQNIQAVDAVISQSSQMRQTLFVPSQSTNYVSQRASLTPISEDDSRDDSRDYDSCGSSPR